MSKPTTYPLEDNPIGRARMSNPTNLDDIKKELESFGWKFSPVAVLKEILSKRQAEELDKTTQTILNLVIDRLVEQIEEIYRRSNIHDDDLEDCLSDFGYNQILATLENMKSNKKGWLRNE